MIISGGSNVFAAEVEQVLALHASVREVAVVGVPDDLWGELVVAVVVPHAGHEVDAAVLDPFARQSLAGYKVPRRYVPAGTLPRNAYGKVLKRELRSELGARSQG
jgi:long-chain acyl-CoA synthetase